MKEILGYITQDGKAYQASFKVDKVNGMLFITNRLLNTTFTIPWEEVAESEPATERQD